MRKFAVKLLIFILIPGILIVRTAQGLISEPIGMEGFRTWEGISVLEKNDILTGPFYPNISLRRTEGGDQFKPAGFEVKKDVFWQTDKFGFRKAQSRDAADIVVIGDSLVAGSTLTQSDMFTEKLEKITGQRVYPYAPSNINLFINDKRFISKSPKIVVLVMAEKLFQDIPEVSSEIKSMDSGSFLGLDTIKPKGDQNCSCSAAQLLLNLNFVKFNTNVQKVAIIFDRLKKKYFFDYMRVQTYKLFENLRTNLVDTFSKPNIISNTNSKIRSSSNPKNDPGWNMATDGSMVFSVQADDYFISLTDKKMDFHVWKMKGYRDYLKTRGIRFIVAIIPNKENIYYKIVPGQRSKPDFIRRFNEKALNSGLEVADLQLAFDKSYEGSPKDLLFQIDDSHWNPKGAEFAAEEVAKEILVQ